MTLADFEAGPHFRCYIFPNFSQRTGDVGPAVAYNIANQDTVMQCIYGAGPKLIDIVSSYATLDSATADVDYCDYSKLHD